MEETVAFTRNEEDVELVVEKDCYTKEEIRCEAKKRADIILSQLTSNMTYKLEDRPPWYSTILLAFQHFLTTFNGCITAPVVMAPFLCIQNDISLLSRLISTAFFVGGVQTFLQTTFGSRLPIVQGPSFAFVLPMISMMTLRGECPAGSDAPENNSTIIHDEVEDEFRSRMQEVQGALLVAAVFEMIIGFGGIISVLLRFIGPLTIAPTIGLIGMSLFGVAASKCRVHWGIAAFTICLVITFSQYLDRFGVPFLGYTKEKKCHCRRFPFFRLFPAFLAITISWSLCFILTSAGVFSDDPSDASYRVRTDIKTADIAQTPWFYAPYPGQWGAPSITIGGALGMIAAALASIVESIGDYYACARLSGAPPPPAHAVNRGIGVEGFGGMMSGLWGSGVCPSSYSTNIGVIGLTKVSSRLVIQVMSAFLIMTGFILKIGGIFATIPDPVIGGVIAVITGLVTAVGLSTLQYVDMNSPRNLFVIGFSFFMGLSIPAFMQANPRAISTGVKTLDQVLTVLLRTNMFIGGLTGFILDNTIRGTPDQRGIGKMLELSSATHEEDVEDEEMKAEVTRFVNKCYDMPLGMSHIRRWSWTTYIPFCPTFTGFNVTCRPKYCSRKKPSATIMNNA